MSEKKETGRQTSIVMVDPLVLQRYELHGRITRISSVGKTMSGNLGQGEVGYTEGVYNCIAVATPDKLMHVTPNDAYKAAERFLRELRQPLTGILVAGGRGQEKELARVIALMNKKCRQVVTQIPPSDNSSIAIAVNPETSTVEYAIVTY